MTEQSKSSMQPSESLEDYWERRLLALDEKLRASGRTVTVWEAPSDSTEFEVRFPPRRKPSAHGNRPVHAGQALRAAYLRTVYSFDRDGRTVSMRIGQPCAEVAQLLGELQAKGAAFVTACNPPFLPPGSIHNEMAMRDLKSTLKMDARRFGWHTFEGEGRGEDGAWPAEPSVLVVGMPREEAMQLGRCYGQNAIVWIERDSVPGLVELTDFASAARTRRRTPYFPVLRLSVPWGYEQAELTLRSSTWRRLLEGESMTLRSWGYNDGERFRLSWNFTNGEELWVDYGDDGGTAYVGPLRGVHLFLPS